MPYLLVNRAALIIRPKQPFLDWLLGLPGPSLSLTLADLQHNCDVVLIPELETDADVEAFVNSQWAAIFEMELDAWHTREAEWPARRTLKMFREWFDVELHEMIWDSARSPLRREKAD